jgi:hypothetical protein
MGITQTLMKGARPRGIREQFSFLILLFSTFLPPILSNHPVEKNVAREPTHRPLHMLWVCWMPLVPNQSPLACETLSDPPVGALGVGRSCVLAVQGRGGFC